MAYIPFLNNAYFTAKVGIGTESPQTKLQIGPLTGGDGTAQERLRLTGDYTAAGSGAPVSKLVTCHRFMIMRGIEWDQYKNVFQTKSSVSCRRERCFLLRASFDNHSDRSSGWGGVAFHCKNKLFESALQ